MSRHLLVTTLVDEYVFIPGEVVEKFAAEYAAWAGTDEDFVLEMFERHNGSMFGDEIFYNTASPSFGMEIVERGDDE